MGTGSQPQRKAWPEAIRRIDSSYEKSSSSYGIRQETKMPSPMAQRERIFELIEAEKGRDRTLKRISTAAWAVTFVAILFTGMWVAFDIRWAVSAYATGQLGMDVAFREAMPFVLVVGTTSLLVAVLSTVGVSLRFRTASLAEIQLRLAAVEEMIADQAGIGHDETP